nr:MAG TPA: hypothetical protein [Caudoviricetes sp.]
MITIDSPPYFYGENNFFYTGAAVSCNTQVAHVRGVVNKGVIGVDK